MTVNEVYKGMRFEARAALNGDYYEGWFTVFDGTLQVIGDQDSYRPSTENSWATEQEALTYATEAAHHAIDGMTPFVRGGRIEG